MDKLAKLKLTSETLDMEEGEFFNVTPQDCSQKVVRSSGLPVKTAKFSGGSIPLLKSMMTTVCEKNCNYCSFRSGRDIQRVSFTAEEMADTFTLMKDKGLVRGLFLSSGIAGGGIKTQDKIIQTAEILRKRKRFTGYAHLKIMPGADYDQTFQLMRWADRVSVNLEAPNPDKLKLISRSKDFMSELFTRLKWINQIRETCDPHLHWRHQWPSISTQLVVGAAGETDHEILKTSQYLFKILKLSRVYYQPFSPIEGTPFENLPAEVPVRTLRLYQASFLVRDYGYSFEEMAFNHQGNLDYQRDPKKEWADRNLKNKPLEINQASREELLRVPGIGLQTVQKIIKVRKTTKIKNEMDLKNLGLSQKRCGEYMLLDGKRIG
jgi:predicted DNA-binding helix-hairpin-helix protein